MLSDFDCACILESGKRPDSLTMTRGEITGTPMFMARSLCARPTALRSFRTDPGAACDLVFPRVTGVNQRRDEVKQFLKAVQKFERLRSLREVSTIIEAPDHIDHAPIHDAESIFWLIVMFFLRAWPKDYDPKNPDSGERQRRRQRTELFTSMVLNKVMSRQDIRGVPEGELLPPQFHPFEGMLLTLDTYFQQAWHHPYFLKLESDKVSGFRFHGHNALQTVLLSTITQLQETGDIEIKPIPLGVDDDFPFMPYSQPFVDAGLKRGAVPNAGDGDCDCDGKARKRRKKSHATKMNSPMITRSNVDDTARMIEKNSQFAFLMSTIERDQQRRLWFMGDREYVEDAFVEAKNSLPG
ncbi:hypothetical protein F5887DRAFT_482085 [Amanita rubescens]|nr:hypothetical protein F5887DRAFT_482085 [Amanita rubescens]